MNRHNPLVELKETIAELNSLKVVALANMNNSDAKLLGQAIRALVALRFRWEDEEKEKSES